MMKKGLLIGLSAVAIGGAVSMLTCVDQSTYAPRTSAEADQIAPRGIAGAFDYYSKIRRNVNTGQPVTAAEIVEMREAVHKGAAHQTKAVGLQWQEMGPDNVGGRTRAITINPNNSNEIWAGGISGGLWKSDSAANVWSQVTGFGAGVNNNVADDNIAVASIAFAGNGDLVVGTGSAHDRGFGGGSSGFIGGGIFRSTDGGASWNREFGPTSSFNSNLDYVFVDELWADPNNPNGMWVGSSEGLEYYDIAAGTLGSVSTGLPLSGVCSSMAISADGQRILLTINVALYLSTDAGGTFTSLGNGSALDAVANGLTSGRKEVTISQDNSNYMYILHATGGGGMQGVYGTADGGQSWASLWPNPVPDALDIFGDNTQGGYDNVIEAVAGSPTEFWVGGVTLWKGSITGQPLQIAQASSFPGCFNCVHSDVHEITWDHVNQTVYVGCDGGIYKGFITAGQEVFFAANRGYNITQFYGIGFGHNNRVLGGTQDNSSPYLTLSNPNSAQEASVLYGGDGFDSEISMLDPGILFATSQQGVLGRSADGGLNFGSFYSDSITDNANANGDLSDFYTNIRLWETYDDPNSPNTSQLLNIGTDTILSGEKFEYRGRNTSIPLYAFASTDIFPGDTIINLPDPVQSLFATGIYSPTSGNQQDVWVTRDALAVNVASEWWKVLRNAGGIHAFEWSADGNNLFIANDGGQVWLVTGFNRAYTYASADFSQKPVNGALIDTAAWLINVANNDTIKQNQSTLDYANNDYTLYDGTPIEYRLTSRQVHNAAGPATGIASDPQDPNHLVITYGGYGGSNKVKESNNALDVGASFTNIWNPGTGLTGMPCYDAIIHRDNPNIIVVGTEWGVYSTDDGGSNWSMENDGGAFVPVFEVRQQIWDWQTPHWYGPDWVQNPGVIFLGTHGRGIFRSETLLSVQDEVNNTPTSLFDGLTVYPNPSSDITNFTVDVNRTTDVVAGIYDLNGRYVKEVMNGRMAAGQQGIQFNVSDLANGTYILHLSAGSNVQIGRFVVQH